jgi:hypothetical protein
MTLKSVSLLLFLIAACHSLKASHLQYYYYVTNGNGYGQQQYQQHHKQHSSTGLIFGIVLIVVIGAVCCFGIYRCTSRDNNNYNNQEPETLRSPSYHGQGYPISPNAHPMNPYDPNQYQGTQW